MSALSTLVLGAACAAGIEIKAAAGGKFDVEVKGATLSAVLECLAENTGLKVISTGEATPQRRLTLSLRGKTEVQVISELLSEAGFNYGLTTDPQGTRGRVLLLAGKRASATSAPAAPQTMAITPPIPMEPEEAPGVTVDPELAREQLAARARGGDPVAIVAPLWPLPGPTVAPTEELFPEPRPLTPTSLRDGRRLPSAPRQPRPRGGPSPTPKP